MSVEIHKPNNYTESNIYQKLINSCTKPVKNILSHMLSAVFEETDNLLFNAAHASTNSDQHNKHFEQMHLLRSEKNTITDAYLILNNRRLSQDQLARKKEFNPNELCLVSQQEMEQILVTSNLISNSDDLHAKALSQLQTRIQHLVSKTKHPIDENVFLPKCFCDDFLAATNHQKLDSDTKLALLNAYSKHIDKSLAEIYHIINRYLIEADILPQIKNHSATRPPASTSASKSQDDEAITSAPTAATFYNSTPDYNRQVQQFIQSYIQNSMPEQSTTQINNECFYDKKQIIQALSSIQTQQKNSAHVVSFELIRNTLLNNSSGSNSSGSKHVNSIDEKTVDLIELLFNEILKDTNLTDASRTLILRMQIPTVKVAMLDQTFFNNSKHPARLFLNTLSHIGIGITDDKDEILSSIDLIIDNFLDDYEQDSNSFQQALDSLIILFNKELSICQKKELLTQKIVMREHARHLVFRELKNQLQGKIIIKALEPLVLKLWPTQMYQQYINYGNSSIQWTDSVNTLKLIVDSIQTPDTEIKLQYLLSHQDTILQTVQDKLYDTRQDIESINLAIYNLSETYLLHINNADIIDNNKYSFETFSMQTFSGICDDINEVEITQTAANSESNLPTTDKREQLQLLPDEVKPGLWFTLFDGEHRSSRRLKLSVIIMEDARLMFVNRQGIKIMEKDASELANELKENKSAIITDHSVFDQALRNVITALRKSA